MEDPFYSDIDIYNKISNEYEGYKQLLDINSQSDDFNCNPNNLFWQKIKQSSSETNLLTYSDYYGPSVISQQILFEIELTLDQFKTTSQRTTTMSLDFFGYMGGIF
jgi:hypothetical protein